MDRQILCHGCRKAKCATWVVIIFLSLFIIFSAPPRNLDKRTTITIEDKTFEVEADDLETICMLGRGAYGIVDKVKHKQSGTIMAVKVILLIISHLSPSVRFSIKL